MASEAIVELPAPAATPATEPATEPAAQPGAVAAGLGVLAVATLAGCGGGGSSTAAPPVVAPPAVVLPAITITGVTIREAGGAPLTVNGQPGATLVINLPDAGPDAAEQVLTIQVRPVAPAARALSGGPTLLTILINPDPADTAAAFAAKAATTRATLAVLGFPPGWDELGGHLQLSATQIITRALARMSSTPSESYPGWIDGRIKSWREFSLLSDADQKIYQDNKYWRRQELKAWWFRQMVTSSDTLTERLLLFWHNLYTTSGSGVEDPELIARQHRLYRQSLNGNLKTFLYAMSRDPAMCQYLDSARNKKAAPNENFARELMELFTLGERTRFGGYAETDVPDLAKFFTGYLLNDNNEFTFTLAEHETAAKTLFGQTRLANPAAPDSYAKDGDWAIDRILEKADGGGHSYAARYLVTRLWREFLGEPIGSDATRIQVIADKLSGAFAWDLKKLYAEFFASPAFTDTARRGTRLRAPVELFAGFYRPLGLYPDNWLDITWRCGGLDQDLLDPPNVFGWPGGAAWINLKAVVDRRSYVSGLQWQDALKNLPVRLHGVIRLLLLAIDPVDPPLKSTDWQINYINTRVGHLLTDPVYNLG